MISSDTHHARGSGQASYLSILAIVMASIAIGLWFWGGPSPSAPSAAATAVSVIQGPATDPTRTADAARSYRAAVEKAAPSVVNVEVGERPPLRRPKWLDAPIGNVC